MNREMLYASMCLAPAIVMAFYMTIQEIGLPPIGSMFIYWTKLIGF